MLFARSAVAAGLATPALERNQARRKQRSASGHLFDPALEHPTDIGGMTWDSHRGLQAGWLKSTLAYQKMPQICEVRRKRKMAKIRNWS
jgi:hypothetical protein